MSHYGRTHEEWDALEAAGWEFLVSQARLKRTTSYTEMNTVLTRRTGVREFDFNLELLRPHPSPDEKLIFWVGHVKAVHSHVW